MAEESHVSGLTRPYPRTTPELVEDQVTGPVGARTGGVDDGIGTTPTSSNC